MDIQFVKQKAIIIAITSLLVSIFIACTQQSAFQVLKGPYLGQKPPGMTPEVFAPGIISKAGFHLHSSLAFSQDGREVYFTRRIY